MDMLLTSTIDIQREGIGYKPGTKQLTTAPQSIYSNIKARIVQNKLYMRCNDSEGVLMKIQRGDVVTDKSTGFKYTISDHPQLGGGMFHHWEASLETFINK